MVRIGKFQVTGVDETRKFLSPSLKDGTKELPVKDYLKKVISNIAQMIITKFRRIQNLFQTGQWMNNHKVLQLMLTDIDKMNKKLSSLSIKVFSNPQIAQEKKEVIGVSSEHMNDIRKHINDVRLGIFEINQTCILLKLSDLSKEKEQFDKIPRKLEKLNNTINFTMGLIESTASVPKKSLEASQKEVKELKEKIKEVELKLAEDAKTHLTKKLSWKQKLVEAQTHLEEVQRRIHASEETHGKKVKTDFSLQGELVAAKAEVNLIKSEIATKARHEQEMSKKYQAVVKEKEEAVASLETIRKVLLEKTQLVNAESSAKISLEKQYKKVEADLKEAENELKKALAQTDVVETHAFDVLSGWEKAAKVELEETKKQLEEAKSQLATAEKRISTLKTKLKENTSKQESSTDSMRTMPSRLKNEIEAVKKEAQAAKDQVVLLQKQQSQAVEKLREALKKKETVQAKSSKELEDLKIQLEAAEKKLQQAERQTQEIQKAERLKKKLEFDTELNALPRRNLRAVKNQFVNLDKVNLAKHKQIQVEKARETKKEYDGKVKALTHSLQKEVQEAIDIAYMHSFFEKSLGQYLGSSSKENQRLIALKNSSVYRLENLETVQDVIGEAKEAIRLIVKGFQQAGEKIPEHVQKTLSGISRLIALLRNVPPSGKVIIPDFGRSSGKADVSVDVPAPTSTYLTRNEKRKIQFQELFGKFIETAKQEMPLWNFVEFNLDFTKMTPEEIKEKFLAIDKEIQQTFTSFEQDIPSSVNKIEKKLTRLVREMEEELRYVDKTNRQIVKEFYGETLFANNSKHIPREEKVKKVEVPEGFVIPTRGKEKYEKIVSSFTFLTTEEKIQKISKAMKRMLREAHPLMNQEVNNELKRLSKNLSTSETLDEAFDISTKIFLLIQSKRKELDEEDQRKLTRAFDEIDVFYKKIGYELDFSEKAAQVDHDVSKLKFYDLALQKSLGKKSKKSDLQSKRLVPSDAEFGVPQDVSRLKPYEKIDKMELVQTKNICIKTLTNSITTLIEQVERDPEFVNSLGKYIGEHSSDRKKLKSLKDFFGKINPDTPLEKILSQSQEVYNLCCKGYDQLGKGVPKVISEQLEILFKYSQKLEKLEGILIKEITKQLKILKKEIPDFIDRCSIKFSDFLMHDQKLHRKFVDIQKYFEKITHKTPIKDVLSKFEDFKRLCQEEIKTQDDTYAFFLHGAMSGFYSSTQFLKAILSP